LKEHASSPAFKQFGKALAGNLAAAPEIKRADFIAGFEGRSKL
jgi:quinol monooxygenase YgiN